MKITKWIELGGKDVEINIDSEDIANALATETADATEKGKERNIARAINTAAQFYKGIPDAMIADMAGGMRKAIADHLVAQTARFGGKAQIDALRQALADRADWLERERRNGGNAEHLYPREQECRYIITMLPK